jgi:hypothetical protein
MYWHKIYPGLSFLPSHMYLALSLDLGFLSYCLFRVTPVAPEDIMVVKPWAVFIEISLLMI